MMLWPIGETYDQGTWTESTRQGYGSMIFANGEAWACNQRTGRGEKYDDGTWTESTGRDTGR